MGHVYLRSMRMEREKDPTQVCATLLYFTFRKSKQARPASTCVHTRHVCGTPLVKQLVTRTESIYASPLPTWDQVGFIWYVGEVKVNLHWIFKLGETPMRSIGYMAEIPMDLEWFQMVKDRAIWTETRKPFSKRPRRPLMVTNWKRFPIGQPMASPPPGLQVK